MKINQFRFLNNAEAFLNPIFRNWSRCYEWGYVLDVLSAQKDISVHNTSCGGCEIHKQFSSALDATGNKIYNTDVCTTDLTSTLSNFSIYNLTEKNANLYDMVLCISTLEHMTINEQRLAFDNLLDQTKDGGRLIITLDYPDANLEQIESLLGRKCLDCNTRLNGNNSYYRDSTYSHLNIVLIDITK